MSITHEQTNRFLSAWVRRMLNPGACTSKNADCGCDPCICQDPVPVVQLDDSFPLHVLLGPHGNYFYSSGNSYRSDWYILVGRCNTGDEARAIINMYQRG